MWQIELKKRIWGYERWAADMEKILPVFEKNNIAIAFASNDFFVPYMATMIYSVAVNGSEENNYDIVILTSDISKENEQILVNMLVDFTNVSLRIVNVEKYVSEYNFYTENKDGLTKETYYRLLIPEIMAEYDKVLYLDGDMVALVDVADLFHTDLTGYLLASSRDFCGLIEYYNPLTELKKYRDKELKLKQPNDYFIAGMLLINIKEFQELYDTEYLLDFATSREWRQHDQDVLNVLCEGKVKLVSASWDVMKPEFNQYLPEYLQRELCASIENAKIVHFGGDRKPWLCMDAPFSEYFWQYAARTPYIQEIIKRRIELDKGVYSVRGALEQEFRQGKVGARYIVKYIKAWLAYKMKRN